MVAFHHFAAVDNQNYVLGYTFCEKDIFFFLENYIKCGTVATKDTKRCYFRQPTLVVVFFFFWVK